ncbi:thymidine phosphorylase [Aliifodinibius salipaludis]|uniref:thymidine phosphorylase n=1 Tax=Fodinibius salipaludis TaxID=2032627 RepID=A0A2A2G980_9BACT|nr:thymidine phosphorylase [Aliifodinibius salipaludis]PAU93405.1 thymidine phosphorylase [Aliifodinibius salipaludis]
MTSKGYNTVSLIRKKRDGKELNRDEIAYLIDEYTKDEVPDYQMSAFLMASYLNGLNEDEAASLTHSMLHSGRVLDLSDIPGKKVDKHSTGGVGDKLSLILAPIVASYDVPVPMISGRGLGHTGGTLDKMESIPGFNVDMTLDRYQDILAKCRMVMAGQTEEVAPADKRLYALRDVTATVESIPLIAGSIMSKKLAEGIDALVLDVKFGSGAFMKTREDAQKLAETLVAIGEDFGKETVAYLTNMNQPLGYKVGNWLEIEESMEGLQGDGPDDVMEVTHMLAGTMIMLGGKADSVGEGIAMSHKAVENGQAFEKWLELTEEQGGDTSVLKDFSAYDHAEYSFAFKAPRSGYITEIDAYSIGMASLELGAGRKRKDDIIDPAAGIELHHKIGSKVEKGQSLVTGYMNNENFVEASKNYLKDAFTIKDAEPESTDMITHRVDREGIHPIGD